MAEDLKVQKEDRIAILTLNRPKVMNSLNFVLLRALKKEIEALRFDWHKGRHCHGRRRKSLLRRSRS